MASRVESPVSRLSEAVEAEYARARSILATIKRQEDELAEEQAAFREARGVKPVQWPGRIKVDVGGEKFFTTVQVLQSKPGLLRAVCDGVGAVQLDAEGCLFIDRCPDSFRFVLDHLNGNPLHMDTMTRSEREMLALDAEFYELDELRGDNKTLAISPHALVCVPNASREENQLLLPFIQEAMNHLARRKAEWDAERAASVRIEQKVASAIGGEKVKLQFQEERCQFSTCVATLTRTPSMLAHKFADASWRKEVCEDDGTIFISRSGQTFALVLNVLRGYPSPTHLSAEQRRLFLLDLDYYGLPPLPPQTVDRAPQPRRPMTAYLYFQAERQNDENNSGRMDWKALTEEQKRPFNERAAEDKARYEREKRAWKKQNL